MERMMADDNELELIPGDAEPTEEEIFSDDVVKGLLDKWWTNDEPSLDTDTTEAPVDEVEEKTDDEEEEAPRVPPGGPVLPVATTETPLPPSTLEPVLTQPAPTFTFEQVQQLLEMERAKLTPPGPSPTFPSAPTQPPVLPPLPPLTEDDLADPAIRALLIIANQQKMEIDGIRDQMVAQSQVTAARHVQDSSQIIAAATSNFRDKYQLPEEVMRAVRTNAADFSPMVEPLIEKLGDPYLAIDAILEKAYWVTPEARQYEVELQTKHLSDTSTRKKKLAAIGGSSGSGQRNAPNPDLETPEGRRKAMVAFVEAAMNGNEGDN